MESTPVAAGLSRRERAKQDKLERITAAAAELLAGRSIDDVTTQEVAERADVGAGTLFLYVHTKGDLLLLVQNQLYARALDEGRHASAEVTDPVGAVMALLTPIVRCNRTQVENGRTYLKELVFGDATEPRHQQALAIVADTEEHVARVIARTIPDRAADAADLSAVTSAVLLLAMASPASQPQQTREILATIRRQLQATFGAPDSPRQELATAATPG